MLRRCSLIDHWPHRLDAVRDDARELDWLFLEHDLALADARHVEQLVHQARKLCHLPVDDVARHYHALLVRADAAHQLDGVADRRERVSQLVRQHRQELVLAAVRVLQLLLRLARAGDLALERAVQARVLEGHRGASRELLEHLAVLRLTADVAERKGADQLLADLQRIADGRRKAALLGQLVRAPLAQHRLQRLGERGRDKLAGRRRNRLELARLFLHRDGGDFAGMRHDQLEQPPHAVLEVERGAELAARVREEVGAATLVLGRMAGRLGFRHGARALLHLPQLDEHLDLAAQDIGAHRREDVVDRAERIALRRLHLVGVGGDEDDRRVRRLLVLPDELRRLQAVDVGHVDVEQDHRELARQHLAQRFRARAHHHQVLVELLEDRAEDEQLLRQIVDDQDVGFFFAHRLSPGLCAGPSSGVVHRCSQPRSTESRCSRSTGFDR